MNDLEKYFENQKLPRAVKTQPKKIYIGSWGNDVHFVVRQLQQGVMDKSNNKFADFNIFTLGGSKNE